MTAVGTKALAFVIALTLPNAAAAAQSASPDSTLWRAILRRDSLLFTAYNACDTLALPGFFTPDIEFYHDEGGLTVGRQQTLAAINDRCRQIAQGKVAPLTRERLPANDAIYPVPGFGAMQMGRHRFTRPVRAADPPSSSTFGFAQVWAYSDSTWRLRRVLSFGHR